MTGRSSMLRSDVSAITLASSPHFVQIDMDVEHSFEAPCPSHGLVTLLVCFVFIFTTLAAFAALGGCHFYYDFNLAATVVARCTVARLMRKLGLEGATRGPKKHWTTIADDNQVRPADLVNRQFSATRPNQLWVADITFVATWSGIVHVAFIMPTQ